MTDDLANNWGCNLTAVERRGRKRVALLRDKSVFFTFKCLISNEFDGQFVLQKVTPNGSDANLYAVNYLTKGNNDCCLIACGSYVAGDMGPLHSWTTSTFTPEFGPSGIMAPNDVATVYTRQHTIALPYHIPGCLQECDLCKYEDDCLNHLHIRCLVQKMKKVPIRALIMEIILANNGATISDRALKLLGELAHHHSFKIIVDEIMTGGRTGTMLLSTSKPTEFVNAIAHVTMGKWLQVGLVLTKKDIFEEQVKPISHMPKRGSSTSIDCKEPLTLWKSASDEITNSMFRREKVLKKLQLKRDDAWGQGVLIFAPIYRKESFPGTRNRFLPLLCDTPFFVGKFTKKGVQWTKNNVNDATVLGCKGWLEDYYLNNDNEKTYHMLIMRLAPVYPAGSWLQARYILDKLFGGKPYNLKSIGKVLRAAKEAGLLIEVKKTVERLRAWQLEEIMTPPWGLPPDKEEEKVSSGTSAFI